MELKENQIVELRNGLYGVTAAFNGKVFQLIFTSYSTPIKRYNKDLFHASPVRLYDIVRVYDGSAVPDVTMVFKKKFNPEGLPVLFERENDITNEQ